MSSHLDLELLSNSEEDLRAIVTSISQELEVYSVEINSGDGETFVCEMTIRTSALKFSKFMKDYILANGIGNLDLSESEVNFAGIITSLNDFCDLDLVLAVLSLTSHRNRSDNRIQELAKEVLDLKSRISLMNKNYEVLTEFVSNQTLQVDFLTMLLDQTNQNFKTLGLPTVDSYTTKMH